MSTVPRLPSDASCPGVYSLDCEMVMSTSPVLSTELKPPETRSVVVVLLVFKTSPLFETSDELKKLLLTK